jgi:hypothetical protein
MNRPESVGGPFSESRRLEQRAQWLRIISFSLSGRTVVDQREQRRYLDGLLRLRHGINYGAASGSLTFNPMICKKISDYDASLLT